MRVLAVLLLLLGNAAIAVAGACPGNDLSSLATASKGAPIVRHITRELMTTSVDKLVKNSILVLTAQVRPLRSYLSADGCQIFTDYEVTPISWIVTPVTTAPTPGQTNKHIIVTLLGGSIKLDGISVSVVDDDIQPVRSGVQLVLFLQKSIYDSTKYQLTDGIYGAFEVAPDDSVIGLVKGSGVYPPEFPHRRSDLIDRVQALRHRG